MFSEWFDWKETEDLGQNIKFHKCKVIKPFGPFRIDDGIYFIDVSLEDGDIFCYGPGSVRYYGKIKLEII